MAGDLPDTVALLEPLNGEGHHERSRDPRGVCDHISQFVEQTKERILTQRRIPGRDAMRRWLGRPEARPVHFLHVGKTGGTAFKHAVRAASPPPSRCVIHLHPHRVVLRDVPEGERFLFFLRDPVTRYVSGFYSRQREGRPKYRARWSPEEREAFGRFATPGELALALSSDDREEGVLARAAMRNIRHVRDGYWKWFESEDYFRSRVQELFFIGFQETLAGDFEILKSRLGLPSRLMLPDNEVEAHISPPGLDRRLRAEAVENLRNWYEEDYRFLDLCREIIRDNPRSRAKKRRLREHFLGWV